MMSNTFIANAQKVLKQVYTLQEQISTGKKFKYASDNPVAAAKVLNYSQIISETEQYKNNIASATTTANNVDTVLGDMESVLLDIRDLAVKASNEAVDDQATRDIDANNINSLIDQLISESNQKFDGKSMFSGDATATTPFVARDYLESTWGGTDAFGVKADIAANGAVTIDMPSYTIDGVTTQSEALTDSNSVTAVYIVDDQGNRTMLQLNTNYTVDPANNRIIMSDVGANGLKSTDTLEIHFDKTVAVIYKGNSQTNNIEVGESTTVDVAFAGATSSESKQTSVFGKYSSDGTETSSVEAFQKLLDLRDRIYKYDQVAGGNITAISAGIDDADEIRENITNIRAEQGSRVNQLDLASNRLSNISLNTTELKSNIEDTDMAEAATAFTAAQTTYNAALQVGALILQTTLLDFLK
jgi:flagellar hook-associated protein 3 FlgL